MKNTKTWQRVLSMAVCLCMIVGLVPAIASPASAETGENDIIYYFAHLSPTGANSYNILLTDFFERVNGESPVPAWRDNEGEWSIYKADGTASSGTSYVERFGGLTSFNTTTGGYVTLRIEVPTAGWYTPVLTLRQSVTHSGRIRMYISKLPDGASERVLTADEKTAARASANSVGSLDEYTSEETVQDVSGDMRTMKFEAGTYVVVLYAEALNPNSSAYPQTYLRNITLKYQAAATAAADEVVPSMNFDAAIPVENQSIEIGTSEEFDLRPVMSTGAVEDLVNVPLSNITVTTSDSTALKAEVTADTIGYKKVKLTSLGKVSDDTTVFISVIRDGITYSTTNPIPVKITDSTVDYSYTYNFGGLTDVARWAYLNGYDNGVVSENPDYSHKNSEGEVDWKVIDAERETVLTFRYYTEGGGYLSCHGGGLGKWINIRFNVERPGWYDLSLKTFLDNGGAKVRAFVTTADAFDAAFEGYSDRWVFGTALEPYSVGTVNCYAESLDTSGTDHALKRVKFNTAGEYSLVLVTEENYNTNASGYSNILLKSFTIDRVAFADAAASTVLPAMNLSTIVPDTSRTFAVEDGAQKFAFITTMASGAEYVDDLVGANATVVSSDTDVVKVSTVKQTNPEGAYGNALRTKDLVITPVAAGEANVTITATRDGVTYTEVIPITVTHNVANFGTAYAYIQETYEDGKPEYKIAMISGLDFEEGKYKTVGFEYYIGNQYGEIKDIQKVYQSIQVGENGASLSATELGDVEYLFYGIAESISPDLANQGFKFRAYAVDQNDDKICGGWLTLETVVKPASN